MRVFRMFRMASEPHIENGFMVALGTLTLCANDDESDAKVVLVNELSGDREDIEVQFDTFGVSTATHLPGAEKLSIGTRDRLFVISWSTKSGEIMKRVGYKELPVTAPTVRQSSAQVAVLAQARLNAGERNE